MASPPPLLGADEPPDQELIERVLAGDKEEYARLVRRYQERLYRHALGMVLDSDVAADLVQDAFVKAYIGLAKCRDRSRFGSWLFQILRNRCLDHLKERRRSDHPIEKYLHLPSSEKGPEWRLERRSLREVIERALGTLPASQREAFLLKHVHDLSYEEMAAMVNASVSALRMRVLRARETLQAYLGDSAERETDGCDPREAAIVSSYTGDEARVRKHATYAEPFGDRR